MNPVTLKYLLAFTASALVVWALLCRPVKAFKTARCVMCGHFLTVGFCDCCNRLEHCQKCCVDCGGLGHNWTPVPRKRFKFPSW